MRRRLWYLTVRLAAARRRGPAAGVFDPNRTQRQRAKAKCPRQIQARERQRQVSGIRLPACPPPGLLSPKAARKGVVIWVMPLRQCVREVHQVKAVHTAVLLVGLIKHFDLEV